MYQFTLSIQKVMTSYHCPQVVSLVIAGLITCINDSDLHKYITSHRYVYTEMYVSLQLTWYDDDEYTEVSVVKIKDLKH